MDHFLNTTLVQTTTPIDLSLTSSEDIQAAEDFIERDTKANIRAQMESAILPGHVTDHRLANHQGQGQVQVPA